MAFPKLLTFLIAFCILGCENENKTNAVSKETVSNEQRINISTDTISTSPKAAHSSQPPKPIRATLLNAHLHNTSISPLNDTGFQTFTFSNDRDTTLICKEGTKIKIGKESFELTEPNLVSVKDVKLKIIEYYSIADMLAANLSTTSNGAILETGGMLFIQAFSDGKPCKLKEGKVLEISFPFSKRKDDMIAFTGDYADGKMNWTTMFTDTIPVVEQPAVYPGGIPALRRFLANNLEFPDSLADTDISGTILLDFIIDETGRPIDVSIKNKAHQAFREVVMKTYNQMPVWKPALKNGTPVKSSFSQTITFFNTEGDILDTLYKQEFETRVNDTIINSLKVEEIRYYVLSVSRLGWINCDRFLNDPRPKTDFLVNVGNYRNIDVKIVLHSFKSILQGEDIITGTRFKGVPLGEEITIVAVKKIENINYLAIVNSNTHTKTIENLPFESVSMKQLMQKLEQLNNLHK